MCVCSQDPYATIDVAFHEQSHNFGNYHSTTPGNEYGDTSCAMGACCNVRCHNAAQMYHLDWNQAVPGGNLSTAAADFAPEAVYPATFFPEATNLHFTVPATATARNHYIRVGRALCCCMHTRVLPRVAYCLPD